MTILIFPTRNVATAKQLELLRVAALERQLEQFEAAAESAAMMADACLSPEGKQKHAEVADYFRLHAAISRDELATLVCVTNI